MDRLLTKCIVLVGLQIVTSNLSKYTRVEGDNLIVRCNATVLPDIEVYWAKNDSRHPFRQNGTDLLIFNIDRTYSGQYVCYALNMTDAPYFNATGANITIDVITVDVEYPAEIDRFNLGPTIIMENATFSIGCNFQAHPDPTWTIMNLNTGQAMMSATVSGDATLQSPSARCEDMGLWVCTGYNRLSHGKNVTRGANLTVLCPPRPVWGQSFSFEGSVGQPATVTLNFTSYPRPKRIWSRPDGQPMRVAISDWPDRTELVWDHWNPVKVSDFGNYTIMLQNEYGTYTATMQLTANGFPETPRDVHIYNVTDQSVTVRWTSGFDMGSQQHFIVMRLYNGNTFSSLTSYIYDNSTTHGINQTWTHVVNGLNENTFYNISVVAENQRGYRGFSQPITFTTQASPKNFDPLHPVSPGVVVGVVVGSVIVVLGICAALVFLLKWRRMRTSYEKA
ncbi:hypothetical protein DPMN_075726 [Dreissena polymorpha]|uniref:Uncharacterized protein n=2 Tax=Dreissena polymorpha TaxID=45954 RepID=A0A9D3YHD2_DREPO|nr:hypothetical protein DPMN_075726 [Dreissena polymorpha]